MMSFQFFSILMFIAVLLPIVVLATFLILKLLQEEIHYLELENNRIQLESRLQQSEFMQLSQQIHPHFMFNTLNALMSLARLNRKEDLISGMEHFSMFLRNKYRDKKMLIPFHQEFKYTEHYLTIQQLRFGKKLLIHYDLDSNALETTLPPYVLQTLVENAFKHGLEKKRGRKFLSIILRREGNWVELLVIDNGDNHNLMNKSEKGIGLENIRQRLNLLYDLPTYVTLKKNEKNETEARLFWPYQP